MKKIVTFELRGDRKSRQVWLNGKQLLPAKSYEYSVHSLDGFNWGYDGSGPLQLALAICIELFGTDKGCFALRDEIISNLPLGEDFDREIEWRNPRIEE